jgi:hypothetical protein
VKSEVRRERKRMRSRQAKVEAEVKVVQSTSVIETFTLKSAPMLGAIE